MEVFEEGGSRVLSDLLGGIPLERWEALSSSAERLTDHGMLDLPKGTTLDAILDRSP